MAERGGLVGRILQEVEDRAGVRVVSEQHVQLLEQAYTDLRVQTRDLDLLAYTALDYVNANPKELRVETRRVWAQKAHAAWIQDPQYARSLSLLNDFTFGRGVPQPRAKDKKVQEVLQEFWDDYDNKLLLTTHEGQMAMGTSLALQSNLFILIFKDGRDGKVKTGLLNFDSVEDVVEDEENRLRVLYYIAKERRRKYNYQTRRYDVESPSDVQNNVKYYEHWSNVQSLVDDGVTFEKPPANEMGDGLVYHLIVNRTTEMHFGVPESERVIRWASSYNEMISARVDMAKAAAAFIMKRKVQGSPTQLAKQATRALSRQSPIAGVVDPFYPQAGRPASIINENQSVSHEPLKLDTGASQAAADAGLIHGQIAAGVGFPTHYLGMGDANLALATAQELFVTKMIESRQQVFEGLYKALCDMVIQKAIDDGKLDPEADPPDPSDAANPSAMLDDPYVQETARGLVAAGVIEEADVDQAIDVMRQMRGLVEVEDEAEQERETERDLTYEFSMPSPLRRTLTDLVTAVQGVAQTFDPNNTNVELSRVLLTIALGEALEVDDPGDLVEKIFPEGYVDPLLAQAQAQQGAPGDPSQQPNMFGPQLPRGPSVVKPGATPADASAGGGSASYGAPMTATPAENQPGMQQSRVVARRRDGGIVWELMEGIRARPEVLALTEGDAVGAPRAQRPDESEQVASAMSGRASMVDADFDEVEQAAMSALAALTIGAPTNGHGHE